MEQRPDIRRKPTGHSFDTRPAQVEKWIHELPLANPGESSRRLFEALTDTNTLDIPADQRLRMLELFNEPVRHVVAVLKKHFVGQPFPLTDKARQIAGLAQTILIQAATGYHIVADESGDKRSRLVATHRALNHLGQALLHTYQVYAPFPPGVWQRIHRLYRQAEAAGFQLTPVDDDNAATPCSGTVEHAYKRILLLALACPYRLRPGEAEQIHRWLCDWSQHATLSGFTTTRIQNSLFVANLASDDPPTYLVLRDSQYDQDDCRLLNAARLADTIRDTLGQGRNDLNKAAQMVNDQVLRRLMLAWGVMPKRRFSRSQKHATAVVAMGLGSSHYFISGEVAFDAGGEKAASLFGGQSNFKAPEPRKAAASHQAHAPDVWELGGARPLHDKHAHPDGDLYIEFSSSTETSPLPPAAPAPEPKKAPSAGPAYQAREWKMINVSAGGYRLLWDSSDNSQAQVGELLGLRESSDPDSFHLSLGVVRWMKQNTERGLELGVEMLSPGAVAIGTRNHKAKGSEYVRSLLLPAIKAIGQPATLLTPALPYHVGDVVSVSSHGKEARVELTKVVENTGSFAQFQFRPLDSQSTDAPSSNDAVTDFSALWNQL
jgi:hypothetical protein